MLRNAHKAMKLFLFLIVAVMIVVGVMQVVWRYILESALPWSEELLRFMFIWATFVGTPIAMLDGRHAAIDLIRTRLKGKSRKIYSILITLLEMVVFVFLIVYGIKLCQGNVNQMSPALQISMGYYVISAVPAGGILGLCYGSYILYRDFANLDKEECDGEEEKE